MTAVGRVLVVVPAFDAAGFIAATLGSVSAQSHAEWSCVVVDDGSRDGTAEVADRVAAADDRFSVLRQANAGVSAARTAGLGHAPDAELVLFLDADDLLAGDALGVLVAGLAARPDAVGCHGWAELCDAVGVPIPGEHPPLQRTRLEVGQRWTLRARPLAADTDFATLAVYGNLWPPATVLLRRAEVERAGGFLGGVGTQEDWDLFLRMSRRGPFAFIDRQVATYRRHGANRSADDSALAGWRMAVRWRTYDSPATTADQRARLRAALRVLQLRGLLAEVGAVRRALRRGARAEAVAAAGAAAFLCREACRPGLRSPDRLTSRQGEWLRALDVPVTRAIVAADQAAAASTRS